MQEPRVLAVSAAPVVLQQPAKLVAVAMAATLEPQALQALLWALQ
jgi:hypothetical protein